ncbi:hypothetical protein HDU98_002801 [Podochytrium sp. JEL0797]|nr:hypothetical protein HDU98_002801 [Podochytrium sp. JEL0797]
MVVASLVLEGAVLAILTRSSRLPPLFYFTQILAYVATGSLFPVHLFRLLDESVIDTINACISYSAIILLSINTFYCTMKHAYPNMEASESHNNWIKPALSSLAQAANRVSTAIPAPEGCDREQMNSKISWFSILFVTELVKLLCAMLIHVFKSYYVIMLGLSAYNMGNKIAGEVRPFVVRASMGSLDEYREESED